MAGSISGIDWASRMPVSGVYTVVADDYSAGAVAINTGMSNATGCIVQVWRSDVDTSGADVDLVAGVLTISDVSAGYALTTGDVINWIVF